MGVLVCLYISPIIEHLFPVWGDYQYLGWEAFLGLCSTPQMGKFSTLRSTGPVRPSADHPFGNRLSSPSPMAYI